MSFIGESRKGIDSHWDTFVCLDEEDCQLLVKAVEKIAAKHQKNFEKWYDLHEGGEMTDSQSTRMMQAEDKMERSQALLSDLRSFIKISKKSEEARQQLLRNP